MSLLSRKAPIIRNRFEEDCGPDSVSVRLIFGSATANSAFLSHRTGEGLFSLSSPRNGPFMETG